MQASQFFLHFSLVYVNLILHSHTNPIPLFQHHTVCNVLRINFVLLFLPCTGCIPNMQYIVQIYSTGNEAKCDKVTPTNCICVRFHPVLTLHNLADKKSPAYHCMYTLLFCPSKRYPCSASSVLSCTVCVMKYKLMATL